MEVHRDLLWAIRQPIRDQTAQQGIPLLLQITNTGERQLLGQVAAHGIGVRRAAQVGTRRFDGAAARGSRQHQAPQIAGLTAVAVGREWNVASRNNHGIMQGLLVGQTDRLGRCRFAHHDPPFAREEP